MLLENEKWIEGYEERYAVNTEGDIISYVRKTPIVMKGGVIFDKSRDSYTYRQTCLTDGHGNQTNVYNHKCVAMAFIPNPENKKTVNHIDGNKINNKVSNLEWNTHSENTQHAHDTGLIKYDREQTIRKLKLNTERYILTGKTDYADNMILRKYVTKNLLKENHIPPEISTISFINGYPLNTWNHYIDVFRLCESDRSLSEISKIVGMDPSMISLLRNGKRGKKPRRIYEKYKDDPYYFVNYEKIYNYN